MKRVLVIAFFVAACGSTVPPGTTPPTPSSTLAAEAPAQSQSPTASAIVPTATLPTGLADVVGHAPGTISITVGTHALGGVVTCRALGEHGLSVFVPLTDDDAFDLVFAPDGTVYSLSGSIRGVAWTVTQDPQGTRQPDKTGTFSGTFSGKDDISGADVSGTFACK